MKSELKVRYFPFSPGIPWQLRSGKFIVPGLAAPLWNSILKEKKVIVAAYGGLLESFFSFSILEAINHLSPQLPLFWAGDKRFVPLLEMQGLAKYYPNLDPLVLEKFPVPLFLDKGDGVYFNCLNNYIKVKTYYGTKGYTDRRVCSEQIFEKGMIPWDIDFVPIFRNDTLSPEINNWLKSSKLYINQSFVVIVPDRTGLSQHDISGVDWTITQVKSFGAMLAQKNIALMVFTDNPNKYYDPALHVLPLKLDFLMHLLPKAKAVLSRDIDFLFIANAFETEKIFCNPLKGQFDLNRNNKFLNKSSHIYYAKGMVPMEIFNKIMENK